MKNCRSLLLLLVGLSGVIFFTFPGYASDDPYRKALSDLLNDLDYTISDADKRMVAHPTFLEELRELVERYRGTLRTVFLKEDFSDGNYTRNPKWVVVSGRFEIAPSKRLGSYVNTERPVEKAPEKKKDDLFGAILKEVIKSTSENNEEKKPAPQDIQAASIRTSVQIGPAFEIDLGFLSQSKWGSMEVILLGGEGRKSYYRMVYNASPSAKRPIQIFRERNSRSYLIDEAIKYPVLDDGATHRIQWIRDVNGTMKVLVDETVVLSTVEMFYQEGFTGLSLVNNGGTYEWGPIDIFDAPRD